MAALSDDYSKVGELLAYAGVPKTQLDDGSAHEVLKNFPSEGELIQRVSRHGWGAHVDLLPHYWMLTWWAPK